MKHEVLGSFWVHMALDWSIYWKILTFAGKNLEISNISVIYVCLKFWPKMTKNRLKTKNLQQFCYLWCHIFFIRITIVNVLIVLHLFFNQKQFFFVYLSSKTVNLGFSQFPNIFVADWPFRSFSAIITFLRKSFKDKTYCKNGYIFGMKCFFAFFETM